ncbi:unnamed protein product, partial [Adineta steineri]
SMESKLFRTQLSDIVKDETSSKIFRSISLQDDESVFLDEDVEPVFSPIPTKTPNDTPNKMTSFFVENYDHENTTNNTIVNNGINLSNEIKRRKSLSSRFCSISKDTTIPDISSISMNTSQENILSSRIIQRHNKYIRSQTIITTTEPKTAPNKTYMTRKARSKFFLEYNQLIYF